MREYQNAGVMECGRNGGLECWSMGVLEGKARNYEPSHHSPYMDLPPVHTGGYVAAPVKAWLLRDHVKTMSGTL